MHTLANSEDPDEMPHDEAFLLDLHLFDEKKMIFRERNAFEFYDL